MAVGVSLAASVGATAVSATVDPVDTSTDPSTTNDVPVDTEVPAPSTSPVDAAPTDTSAATDASFGAPDQTLDAAQEDSVSPWWWVVGGLVAAAAAAGIASSLRRRSDDETWARSASTMCDTGRALAASIDAHLDEAVTWAPPERVAHQRARFTAYLRDAGEHAPSDDLAELAATLSARNDALGAAIDALSVGAPIDAARAVLEPPLADLAETLTALEHEATTIVYGAALPSSRTTG